MTADDQIRPAAPAARLLRRLRGQGGRIARALAFRPSVRHRRAWEAEIAAAVGRLDAEVRHLRERHGEQIENLEGLVRELVRTAESLRRASATPLDGRAD